MTDSTLPVRNDTPTPTRSIRWSRVLVWVLLVGLLSIVGWKLWQSGLGQVASGSAPDFTLNTFDASWCIPCRDEAPILERTWRAYQDRGVVFIGVAYLDDETAARNFIAEFGVTYPNGADLGTRISTLYRIKGVPETFFVNSAGELDGVYIGPLSEAELQQRIEALLLEAP